MEMKDGMLGVVIIALAMVVAFAGAYLAGITASSEEVVKYNYLADVNGLFDTEQYPQYIEFDPSTNYTGYYSEESKNQHEEGYYFAEDQVGYVPNVDRYDEPRVNNYRLDLEPEAYDDGTVDVSDLESTYHTSDLYVPYVLYYNYRTATNENVEKEAYMYYINKLNGTFCTTTLAEFLDYMNLHESGEYLLTATGVPSDGNSSPNEVFNSNWILFTNKESWIEETIVGEPLNWTQFSYRCASNSYNQHNGTSYPTPPIACKATLTVTPVYKEGVITDYTYTGFVTLYADNEFKSILETNIDVSNCKVCFGRTSSSATSEINLAQSCDYIYSIPRVAYLDPNTGVWMKDGA